MSQSPDSAESLIGLHLDSCRFREADNAFVALYGENAEFSAVARLGQRLLRLDLERVDLADHPELRSALPRSLAERTAGLQFPRSADDPNRGPLDGFGQLIELLLEVFAVRWQRREPLHLLALIHLVGEYAGHMAWQSVLGHACDPDRLADDVGGRSSLWGRVGDDECGHRRSQQHLAESVANREMSRSPQRWSEFLHEEYSRLGELMTVCALRGSMRAFDKRARGCTARCSVWIRHSGADRARLEARARLAALYSRSPLMQMRHSAPIGHFFGVPDLDEITQAWGELAAEAKQRLGVDLLAGDGAHDMPANLAALCSELSGADTGPGRLVADVVEHLRSILEASSGA